MGYERKIERIDTMTTQDRDGIIKEINSIRELARLADESLDSDIIWKETYGDRTADELICDMFLNREQSMREKNDRLKRVLGELYAQVKGECPSLLNEDSGGDAILDMEIMEVLK